MIPELELPNSKNKKEEPPKMKNITPDQHRQRLGIFIASIFAFTLGFICNKNKNLIVNGKN